MSETISLADLAVQRAERRRAERERERREAEAERKRREREEAEEKTRHLREALEETFGRYVWELVWWQKTARPTAVFQEVGSDVAIWVEDGPERARFFIAESGRVGRWQRSTIEARDLADLGDYILDQRRATRPAEMDDAGQTG